MRFNPIAEFGIVHYPGVQTSAIHGLTDMFKVANRFVTQRHDGTSNIIDICQWQLETPGQSPVRVPASSDDENGSPRVLLFPPSLREPVSSEEAAPFVDWILNHRRAGTTLVAICGGAFLLAETGLLAGRSATTHWARADAFRVRFPDVCLDVDRLIIDDGDIISAGGLMAWIDLGLTLVNRFLGPIIMAEVARYLLVDPPGREQRFYIAFSPNLTHGDAAVLKVQRWLQSNGGQDVTLALLSKLAGLEGRTLLRRFRKATGFTPIDYCQRLRVEKGREMLQYTNTPVERIAWDVGYSDTGAFHKVFVRVTGLTPGEYRRRFGTTQSTPLKL